MSFTKMIMDMLFDPPLGTLVGVLLIVAIVLVIGLTAYLGYIFIDWLLGTKKSGFGTIVSKKFTPAHTTTILVYNAATKSSLPQIIHHPDSWDVEVEVDGEGGSTASTGVSREYFEKVKEGVRLAVEYKKGGLTKSNLYIQTISEI